MGVNRRRHSLRKSDSRAFFYRAHGFEFVCLPGLRDSEDAYLQRNFDLTELCLMRAWLRAGDSVVDVGANVGLYAFAAAHVLGRRGCVVAVEASAALVARLEEAAGVLGVEVLRCVNVAIGDEVKDVRFFVAAGAGHTVEQSLAPADPTSGTYVEEVVQMTTLSRLAETIPAIAEPQFVKIDIEGAEMLALRAAPQRWFEEDGPLWIAEIHPGALARFGETGQDVAGMFPSESHELWLLPKYPKRVRDLPPRLCVAGETFDDALFYNLVAVPRAASLEVRRRRLREFLSPGKR